MSSSRGGVFDAPSLFCYDLDSMTTEQEQIRDLEKQVRELNRALVGVQELLRKAGKFEHIDPEKRVMGIQVLLAKAAEYTPRPQRNGRR